MANMTNPVQSSDPTSAPMSGKNASQPVQPHPADGNNLRARDEAVSHPERQDRMKHEQSAIHQAHHVLPPNQPMPRRC